MNSRQMWTLFLGFLILVFTGLFPPVNRVRTMKVINESDDSEEAQEVQSEFHGYRFYFSLNGAQDGQEYQVAKIILAGEWLLLMVVVRTLFVAFRYNKPNLPQSRIFQRP